MSPTTAQAIFDALLFAACALWFAGGVLACALWILIEYRKRDRDKCLKK